MSYRKHESGEFNTGSGRKNRYATSAPTEGETLSSVAIIALVLVLAIITAIFFFAFYEGDLPAWNPVENGTDSSTTPEKPSRPGSFIAVNGGNALEDVYLYSEYAILVRLSDMTTLAHQSADTVMYPASMTKVMTVVTALDYIENLDSIYTVSKHALKNVASDSSKSGLKVGNRVSVRDLLYGISYMSGADSVLCLIDYLGFSESEFVSLMNKKADEIGLERTHFGGAIGMDYENNQTTCREIAAIMAYAMENPLCRELFGGTEYSLDGLNTAYYNSTLYKNLKNNFKATPESLIRGYTLLAAKSGYETKAGYCLVSLIKNDKTGEEFILVTANSPVGREPYNKGPIYDMIDIIEAIEP